MEWHFSATDTAKGRVGGGPPVLIHRNPSSAAMRNKYRQANDQEHSMLDIVMLALGLGFFVVAVGYTYACERL